MRNSIFHSIFTASSLLALVFSCAKGTPSEDPTMPSQAITISATVKDLPAKVNFTPSYDDTYGKPLSMALTWANGDALRVYNHADRSQYADFALSAESIGQKSGKFTGTLSFAAASYDVEVINGVFDYAAQTQPSDGVTTDLKYMASASGVTDLTSIAFTDFSSVLAITVQMPSSAIAAKIKSVDITASADVFNGGNTLSVTFDTIGDAGSDGVLHFFATLPQGDQEFAAGTTLLVKFNAPGEEHDVYTRFIEFPSASTFTNNKLNRLNISAANSATFANTSATGIGSEANPYLVGDKYQMVAMHGEMVSDATTYFRMVDDVDLTGEDWVPLNDMNNPPKSIYFDGNGHIISNLTVDSSGNTNKYPSFVGFLSGRVRDVVFDHATILAGSDKDYSGGVVSGYIGGNSYQGDCNGVTIRNSTVQSGGGTAFVGGLGGRVGKGGEFRNCHIINTSVSTGSSGTNVGGMLAYIASNATMLISDCSAENITVTGVGHYAGGLIAQIASNNPVTILRCHTTGTVTRSSSGRHFGGLVGSVQSANVLIKNCYSTCSVTGYQFNGGLVGSWYTSTNFTGGSGGIEHCYASGTITDKGNSGDGGLVGSLEVPGITITNSIAWNSTITANKYGDANYSSGAVVGRTHPNSHLENNYRKPGMSLTAYWVPSANFDHPDSQKNGDKYYIWKIGSDKVEANGGYTTATALSTPLGLWAYHGKHLDSGITVSPDDQLGFTSSAAIPGIDDTSASDPENQSYTGNNVWGLGTTKTIVDGVQWTNYHGTWEGSIREINIITTTLNEHNKLKLYYNYKEDGKKYLDEKCNYVTNAVAATNGPMTSQFARVDDIVKKAAGDMSEWTNNCAITIDGDNVDIVKVANSYEAATLGNNSVVCAGPLLVWKGNKLTASDEWLAADTNLWLTTGGNAGGQPRTAIGINKEGTKLIQVTVDGRWTSGSDSQKAYGMSTDLLAELMLELGCYKAMNLDGGGGSQMWVYGEGDMHNIVNHPHNCWPNYDADSGVYYWIHNNEVARRTTCCAVYIQSDLKR